MVTIVCYFPGRKREPFYYQPVLSGRKVDRMRCSFLNMLNLY